MARLPRLTASSDGDLVMLQWEADPTGVPSVSFDIERLRDGALVERVAVERNGTVVKRARHAEERLAPGDVLEIVTFVGGG